MAGKISFFLSLLPPQRFQNMRPVPPPPPPPLPALLTRLFVWLEEALAAWPSPSLITGLSRRLALMTVQMRATLSNKQEARSELCLCWKSKPEQQKSKSRKKITSLCVCQKSRPEQQQTKTLSLNFACVLEIDL